MTGFSQSALLQALGWATINSFWQAGALWCAYLLLRRFVVLTPGQQYKVAVSLLFLSLTAFLYSILFYLQGAANIAGPFVIAEGTGSNWFSAVLTAASFSYLILLFVPAARLVQNWRFLRRLRRSQLAKAPVQYRLYVQKIAGHLNIPKNIQVQLSALVRSPVTIGYLKPLILLPVASFNQLSIQQAEAILLHELAHIRRFDYLVNISISFIQTILYFNPFVHLFVRIVENSREDCCDKLVLQFGYDPFAYAGALLHLEKQAAPLSLFVMGATGKNRLLSRIEAIVGLAPKMPVLKLQHFAGLLTSFLFVLSLHSLLVVGKKNEKDGEIQTLAHLGNPFNLVYQEGFTEEGTPKTPTYVNDFKKKVNTNVFENNTLAADYTFPEPPLLPDPAPDPHFLQIVHTEAPTEQLNEEKQQQVSATIAATKKVLTNLEWKKLENSIADGLTESEKTIAFEQYQRDVEQLDWVQVEKNLASRYDQTNWEHLNHFINAASLQMQLDSVEVSINKTMIQLAEFSKTKNLIAFPDQSVEALKNYEAQIQQALDSVKALRHRPIVRF